MKKKITGVKFDSKVFTSHHWIDGIAIYQDNDNYKRSSSFGGKTIVSIVYILSWRDILDLKQDILR